MAAPGAHPGGVHHVRLRPLVSFEEADHQVRYDEEARQLILLKHREFEAIPFEPGAARRALRCDNNGPVINARFSPSGAWVAVQRSDTELELRALRGDAETFVHHARPPRGKPAGRILGFHWVGPAACDLVLVTSWGADFMLLRPEVGGLRASKSVALAVSWYLYSHETRMLFLATGARDTVLQAYQLQPRCIAKVPRFEVELAPAPDGAARSLAPSDLSVAGLHELIYLVHKDVVGPQLVLYGLFKDHVVRRHRLPLYSAHVAVSHVDSTLIVHNLDSKVAMLFELTINAQHPLSAPLPLGGPRAPRAESPPATPPRVASVRAGAAAGSAAPPAAAESEAVAFPAAAAATAAAAAAAAAAAEGTEMYNAQWAFFGPAYVVDHSRGRVCELELDLECVVSSSLDQLCLVQFLLARQGAHAQLAAVVLQLVRTAGPLGTLRRVFSLLHAAFVQRVPAHLYSQPHSALSERAAAGPSAAAAGRPPAEPGARCGARPPSVAAPASAEPGWEAAVPPLMTPPSSARGAAAESALLSPSPAAPLELELSGGPGASAPRADASQPTAAPRGEGGARHAAGDDARPPPPQQRAAAAWAARAHRSSVLDGGAMAELLCRAAADVSAQHMARVLLEYTRSAASHGLRIDDACACLLVRTLRAAGRGHELSQLLQAHALPDSLALARALLAAGHPHAAQGVQMLHRLGPAAHAELPAALAARGQVLDACRVIRAHQLVDAPARPLLARALEQGDARVCDELARFFAQRNLALRRSAAFLPHEGCDELLDAMHALELSDDPAGERAEQTTAQVAAGGTVERGLAGETAAPAAAAEASSRLRLQQISDARRVWPAGLSKGAAIAQHHHASGVPVSSALANT